MVPTHPVRRFAVASNRLGIVAAEAGLLVLMLLTVYAVIARYVFNSPSVHAIEVSAYLLVLVTWASLGWVHVEDRHVCMEALNARMNPGWKKVSRVVAQLTVLVFCLTLVGAGAVAAWTNHTQNYRSNSLLEFPLWIPYAAIPLGALLLALVAAVRLAGGLPPADAPVTE